MLHHDRTPYRWQDHVVTPRQATLNLIATALIVVVVGTAGLFSAGSPSITARVAHATERLPSLAHVVKRPASAHPKPSALPGC